MKKIKLAHPADNSQLSADNCRLQWEPLPGLPGGAKLRYLVVLFATSRLPRSRRHAPRRSSRASSARRRRSKPLPVFTSKALKHNFFDLPMQAGALKPGRVYWWQVRAQDRDGQVVAQSEMRRFKLAKTLDDDRGTVREPRPPHSYFYVVGDSTVRAGESLSANLENFLPLPPVVFGKPVKLHLRSQAESETYEPPEPPAGGTLEPQAMVWANEAGEIYLPAILAEHANIYWDQSYVDGCRQVLLQISGQDGFSEPFDGDVLNDTGLIDNYWGPATISCGGDQLYRGDADAISGTPVSADNIDLLLLGDNALGLPNQLVPDVVRQLRTIPCDNDRQPVDVASPPVTLHIVRNPEIVLRAQTTEWTWGSMPGRTIDFSLILDAPFPDVPQFRFDPETGSLVPADITAPSTLLIFAPPSPSLLLQSSMSNLSLTMNEEPVERRNQIQLTQTEQAFDTYVIPLDQWPSAPGFNFRLEQEWLGGLDQNSLLDFLDPNVVVAVIPGVDPSWLYCGGVTRDFDSLYGREDLPDLATNSPLYHHPEGECYPSGLIGNWDHRYDGVRWFNEFMENTFRGTRLVVHHSDGGDPTSIVLDEPLGMREVEVRFETENTRDMRYIMPNLNQPVMMRETRDSGEELLWQVRYLDGKYAGLYSTGPDRNFYGGRGTGIPAGISRFDPPRLQMWVSVIIGNAGAALVWADIHYDLEAV